jgi:type II secretory ATPase GspE/PulE/Tfp pilus assembly ATPase PilB-like protein
VDEIRALLRSEGVGSLRDDAARLVREGRTTAAEAFRVLGDAV